MRINSAPRSIVALVVAGQLAAVLPTGANAAAPVATNTAPAAPAGPPPFSFIAIGCMPYGRLPEGAAAYGRVLAEINRHAPAFAVHLGDLFGSEELATAELPAGDAPLSFQFHPIPR